MSATLVTSVKAIGMCVTYRHALKEADVELDFIPLDADSVDLLPGEGHVGLPVLHILLDQIVDRITQLVVLAEEGVRILVGCRVVLAVGLQLCGVVGLTQEEGECVDDVLGCI